MDRNIFSIIISSFASLFSVLILGMTAYDTHTAGTIRTGADLSMTKENRNDHTKVVKYEDESKIFRTNEECFVDKNLLDRVSEKFF